ncbi:MAG: hypothetical protein ACE5J5_01250 [Candidatus Hydrothermarchaeales archaeon]
MDMEEDLQEGETIGKEEGGWQIDIGSLLIGLGTLILCIGVGLAFVLFPAFSTQEVVAVTLEKVEGTSYYTRTWLDIVHLIASIIIIWVGVKVIDKGISLKGFATD